MKQMDVYHGVIIYKDTVTPIAKKVVEESKEMLIELFNVEEMQYNITKHVLQPKFEKLNKSESILFKKDFSNFKFPTIKKDDAICKFYGYSKGDIIRITRKNGLIIYRIVK